MEKSEREELLEHLESFIGGPLTPKTGRKLRTLFADYDALEAEKSRVTQDLCDAAREIHCAGTVAHRIRVLKKEHHEHILRLDKRARELNAKLAEAERDRERLDWLDENANPCIHIPSDDGAFDLKWAHATNGRIPTIREAIEEAMKR
jgi:hypothetical protein